ncbi:MAG: tRNA (adenosine(37)-N6)-threonylcarbamoyltransferase complex dimerization subunit type 1 TsaB [Pseudomonadota bacterium]
MKILAFDTTNSTLSVAIAFDKKLIAQKNILENNKHSEMLIPVIEECLRQAEIWYQDLDAIAFTNGPGSFTGIRVGYSCAKALAIATSLPVIAVSSLEVIAYSYLGEGKKILVVNDARLEEFFIQEFVIKNGQLKPSFEPMMIKVEELKDFLPKEKFVLAGSAKNMIKDDLENALIFEQEDFIDAKNIALLAEEKYASNHDFKSSALYIREPKISQRKRK